jgi:hypothetical protein
VEKVINIYYEEIKRELNRILIYEFRCYERLGVKADSYLRDLSSVLCLFAAETHRSGQVSSQVRGARKNAGQVRKKGTTSVNFGS